jgi:hypothetical protein
MEKLVDCIDLRRENDEKFHEGFTQAALLLPPDPARFPPPIYCDEAFILEAKTRIYVKGAMKKIERLLMTPTYSGDIWQGFLKQEETVKIILDRIPFERREKELPNWNIQRRSIYPDELDDDENPPSQPPFESLPQPPQPPSLPSNE